MRFAFVQTFGHHGGPYASPACGTGFTELAQAMLGVRYLAQRGAAINWHFAHFTGAEAHGGVLTFTRHQLHRSTRRTRHLRALARLELDCMDHRADRNVANRQAVARLDGRCRTGVQHVARLNTFGRDDVAALAIGVKEQCNVRGAVGVVFDALDLGGDAVLGALEVDLAVMLFVATTDMTGSDTAKVITAAGLRLLLEERTMRFAFVQTFGHHLNLVAASC